MSSKRSLYWRIGLLLLFVGVAPFLAMRLGRLAFFNNDYRDDAAVYAGHESGTTVVRALHVFRNTLPNLLHDGHACAPAGDSDGDGHADLFVCAAAADGAGGGTVTLRSGATGEVLDRWLLPDKDHGPFDLRALGDHDGDGTQELLVRQIGVHGYGGREFAFVIDGASGRVLGDVFDDRPNLGAWNMRVEPVADVDGDGLLDLCVFGEQPARLVSSLGTRDTQVVHGDVAGVGPRSVGDGSFLAVLRDGRWACVGRDGQPLSVETFEDLQRAREEAQARAPGGAAPAGPAPVPVTHVLPVHLFPSGTAHMSASSGVPGRQQGVVLTEVGDVDGDGLGEVALGAPWTTRGGTVWVRSSQGATLARIDSATALAGLGAALLAWGSDALLIGAPEEGAVRLVSVADGSVLRTLRGESAGGGFGLALANAGDVDGDGHDDLLVEEPWAAGVDGDGDPWRGTVWVLSGADLR